MPLGPSMDCTEAKSTRSSKVWYMAGEASPQSPAGTLNGTSGRSAVMMDDQRLAAFTNAARCAPDIAVVKQRVMVYPAPPPVHPMARKVAGAPVIPATLARSVLGPPSGPSVQLPGLATPLALVVAVAVPTLP